MKFIRPASEPGKPAQPLHRGGHYPGVRLGAKGGLVMFSVLANTKTEDSRSVRARVCGIGQSVYLVAGTTRESIRMDDATSPAAKAAPRPAVQLCLWRREQTSKSRDFSWVFAPDSWAIALFCSGSSRIGEHG
jgi:hypothetical protein